MDSIKSEMPPLHAAEALSSSSANTNSGGGGGNNANTILGESSNNAATSTTSSSNASGQGSTAATTSSSNESSTPSNSSASNLIGNNTISAAADSSDNQPSTPQPQNHLSDSQQQQQVGNVNVSHQPYASHHMYGGAGSTSAIPNMYGSSGSLYANASQEMQQQHQAAYPSYLNSYEQFYQQQQQQNNSNSGTSGNNMEFTSSSLFDNSNNSSSGVGPTSDYKSPGVRYHPYLQTPTSGLSSTSPASNTNGGGNNDRDSANNSSANVSLPLSSMNNGNVSTTSVMSPRVVSSTSPTSTSSTLQIGSNSSVNPSSPNSKLQCKKCGIMCTNESELQEHIANAHGESPYGSSGYASSPYIKEEIHSQQSTPTGHPNHQGQTQQQVVGGASGNPNDLLDLDQQKGGGIYSSISGSMSGMISGHPGHDSSNDPLHSMHSMQQRALPDWTNQQQEGLPPYMQQGHHHQDALSKSQHPNQTPYFSPKHSSFHSSGNVVIKQEYPLIKSEYPDSQNYVDKTFDPSAGGNDMCQQAGTQHQQQQQSMLPVATSPAEFPSTTTGNPQDQQQQYRGFEPPTSSSTVPVNNLATKAASWKSNEARRPKTYNCTACNKWFTSSGHLKRHYNTTLHKNAVKSSGQPDPATLPISAHHHPARDSTGKPRRGGARQQQAQHQQQQPPLPTQPPEPPRSPPDFTGQTGGVGMGLGQMSHYSSSPSPNHLQQQQQMQMNGGGMPYGQANGYPPHHLAQQQQQQQQHQQYMQQVQSTTNASPQHASNLPSNNTTNNTPHQTVLNGHPNGLAGPSAQTTPMPSSLTRGLLNITTTTPTIIKNEIMEDTISPMDMEMLQAQQQQQLDQEQHHLHQQMLKEEMVEDHHHQQQQQMLHYPQHQQDTEETEVLGVLEDQAPPAMREQQVAHYQSDRHYHNSTPSSTHSNSMRVQSPLIISHQQYQEHLQQAAAVQQEQAQILQAEEDNIFSHTPPPQQQQIHMHLQQHNIVDQQQQQLQYTPLDINTQQQQPSNNMQLLQQQHITTHTAPTINMANIHTMQPNHHHHQQPQEQQDSESVSASVSESMLLPPMRNTLLNNTNIQSQQQQLATIHSTTHTPPPQQLITTTQQQLPPLQHTTHTIPSFQQLQQGSGLLQHLEPTMTYHTIIGNNRSSHSSNPSSNGSNEYVQLTALDQYGNLVQPQQMITTADGQILQIIPASQMIGQQLFTLPSRAAIAESYTPISPYSAQRSPQEGDLPPAHTLTHPQMHLHEESQTLTVLPSMPYSPTISSSTTGTMTMDEYTAAVTAHNNLNIKQESLAHSSDQMINNNKQFILSQSSDNMITTTHNIANSSISPDSVSPGAKKPALSSRRGTAQKRKRTASLTEDALAANGGATLPSGRIKCLQCDKEFTKNCYLTQHNKSFHAGEYPFRCQKCGKRFQSEEIYTTHLGRHKSQDKPHKCDLCPKQFHHKTDLRRHIEAIHTGMKQHICDICEKSFCRKDHLRKHMESHNKPRIAIKKSTTPSTASTNKCECPPQDMQPTAKDKFSNNSNILPKITQVFYTANSNGTINNSSQSLQKIIKLNNTNGATKIFNRATLLQQQIAASPLNHVIHNSHVDSNEDNDVAVDDDSLVNELGDDEHHEILLGHNMIKTEYRIIEQGINLY